MERADRPSGFRLSAYDEYAIAAFDAAAADYLSKPVSDARLVSCTSRITPTFFQSVVRLPVNSRRCDASVDVRLKDAQLVSNGLAVLITHVASSQPLSGRQVNLDGFAVTLDVGRRGAVARALKQTDRVR
jgi:hypothetical protein